VLQIAITHFWRITQRFNNPNANISAANFGMFTSIVANYDPQKQGYRQIDFKLRINW
jgi:hypothetical protein